MNAYGSLELFFSYLPEFNVTVDLVTSVLGVSSFSPSDSDPIYEPVSLRIGSAYDATEDRMYFTIASYVGEEAAETCDFTCDKDQLDEYRIRVFFFNKRLSIYINNKWIYSYSLALVDYPDDIDMSLIVNGGSLTIEQINVVELCDGRDAVYVDYEANTDSALSSIIQERPIEMYPGINRTMQFTYDSTKEDVESVFIRRYEDSEQDNTGISSDGLVYALDVSISVDESTAKELGFITKMYRLSDLDTGISKAVKALQKRARQSRHKISITTRVDPRLEIADVYVLDGIIPTGTDTPIYDRVIVEDLSINLSDGINSMTISGRRDVDNVSIYYP